MPSGVCQVKESGSRPPSSRPARAFQSAIVGLANFLTNRSHPIDSAKYIGVGLRPSMQRSGWTAENRSLGSRMPETIAPAAPALSSASGIRYGRGLRRLFRLEESTTFLTHGSFGLTSRIVLAAQEALREEMEGQPVRFL